MGSLCIFYDRTVKSFRIYIDEILRHQEVGKLWKNERDRLLEYKSKYVDKYDKYLWGG